MNDKTFISSYKRRKPGKKTKTVPVTSYSRDKHIGKSSNKVPHDSIFFPAKHTKYSEIISLKNPNEARLSVKKLEKEFTKAKTKKKKRRIIHSANLAANRAGVMSKNDRLEPDIRKQKDIVQRIYRRLVTRLSIEYKEL